MNPERKDRMRFLCFGLGAIGTYIGGSLLDAGDEVVFIEKTAAFEKVKHQGLHLVRNDRTIHIPRIAVASSIAGALEVGEFDAAILAVKSFDTVSVMNEIAPYKAHFPPVLCLQNGVENEELIAQTVGPEHVIGGSITSAVGRVDIANAVVEKVRGVGIETGHPLSARLIEHFKRAGLRTRGYDDRRSLKWSKMLTNLQANALPAILRWTPYQVYSNPLTYSIECAEIQEAFTVMKKMGIQVVDLPGTPVRVWVNAMTHWPQSVSRPLIARLMSAGRGNKLPSFHIDLYAGKKQSEVVFLNGVVARFAKSNNVPAPVNTALTQILTGMADGSIPFERFNDHPEEVKRRIEEIS